MKIKKKNPNRLGASNENRIILVKIEAEQTHFKFHWEWFTAHQQSLSEENSFLHAGGKFMTIGHMIKCLVWTLKSSLDISVLGCQGAGSHDFPQVDQGKTDSEEDDKLVLRYRPQADLYCCIFEVLSILDIKLHPRLILCIHLSLQTPVFYPTVRAATLTSGVPCDHRQPRRGKRRAIGPQQSRRRCFSCTMQLQPTTKR